ncbi:pyrimidine dimer DNA glycosylase/endonuclease V [Rickettsia endosymbiont of Rhinocyllus conicus]|uniref:pyrimidine dimer DNA glycosylase/endonuclease V n=1 Tax=Rickettsia endosymbiont of Rhinocyllus conicus TaxID=3066252 RepID=UPI003132E582
MNIFVTDISPIVSAQALDDKRVVKMILESAQLLSSAIFINSQSIYNDIYKPTHLKHPCTIWTSVNIANWNWLFKHLEALCLEYKFRFNKLHKTEILLSTLPKYNYYLPNGTITTFINYTRSKILNLDFTSVSNVCIAYQKYLSAKWYHDKIKPRWSKRNMPYWFTYHESVNLTTLI